MKTNTPKVQKKVAKKAAKKDLEKTLTERFLEVISQLGHDAGKVGDDITKVGKSIAKKLAKKVAKVQEVVGKKPKDDTSWSKKADAVKKDKTEKTRKVVNHEVSKAKPAAQSVKVTPITTEAHAAQALSKADAKAPVKKGSTAKKSTPAKPAAASTNGAVAKKRPSRAKPKAEVFPEDPETPKKAESDQA